MSGDEADLASLAARLEASGDYKVLRKARGLLAFDRSGGADHRVGVFLDVETTGTDPRHDEVIELAMVSFAYSPDGEVLGMLDSFQAYQEPQQPIPAEITRLTGIDASMVAGHAIATQAVHSFVAPAVLVIAHNAGFDRRFAERLSEVFTTKAWACSMEEIGWRDAGFEGRGLGYLCAQAGFFYDRHRALNDCLAALALLSQPLPTTGASAFSSPLARARLKTWRIWAEHAPYELKDVLKRRGYRWSGGEEGRPRGWWIDVVEEQLELETAFLEREVYGHPVEPLRRRVSARDRYSERC